jgi:Orsellinic acid/F9775 biosynthesis cluster protein D
MAQPIPKALAHLVGLNVEFGVLVCMQCKYVVAPTAISRHLKDKHKAPIELRKQLDEYVQEFPFQYDHTSVPLPSNRSAPQPIIPVLDGHLCKGCPYKTQSRDAMKKHGNIAHDKQRVVDNELYEVVQLQSWFDDRRARYWIVDKSKQAGQPGDVEIASSQTGVEGVGAEEEEEEERRDVSEIGVEGGNKKEDGIDQGMAGFHNRSIIVDDTKDVEEVDRTIEVGSDEEGESEISADDSEDKDYIEEDAEDDVDKSEDQDYVEGEEVREGSDDEDFSVGKDSEVSSDESEEGDAESVEVKEITVGSSDEESVKETIEVNVGERDVVPIVMISVEGDMASEVATDDSKDEDYSEGESCGTVVQASEGEPGSGFESASQESPIQVPRRKRGWSSGVPGKPVKSPRFQDSGVIIESSEDDRGARKSSASGLSGHAVMRSSPPVMDWPLGSGTSHGRHVEESAQPASERFSSDPFSSPVRKPVSMSAVQLVSAASSPVSSPVSSPGHDVQFGQMDDNEPQPRSQLTGEGPQISELMEYLEQWSGVCPLCHLIGRAGDKEHNIKECAKDEGEEIAKAIVAREEGLQEIRAFKKIGCCGSCGLPTAICESERCPRREGGDRQCRYKGVIIPAVVTMLTKEGCREGVEVLACWFEQGGVDQQKSMEVDEWFGREIEWNRLKIVQVVRVFYMLARKNTWWMRCRKPRV